MTTFGVSSYFVFFGTFLGKMMPASHEILQRAWKENGRLSLFLFMLKAKLQSSWSHLEEEEIQIFIGPESDHWECLSLTHWLTNSLTDSVTFNWLELMAVIRFSRLEKKLLYISTAGRGCQTLKRQQMCDLKLACHRMWEILFLLHTFTVRTWHINSLHSP